MLDPERFKDVVALLDTRFGLDVLYVFGSTATETASADSDVDLAALFARPVPAAARLGVLGDLASVLGRDVDLVDLDDASPIVAMQVLRHGRIVHEADRRRRVAFEAATPGRYEDLVRIRQPQVDALLRRLDGRP
jgi:predicted nucleotidyltransferase